MHNIFYELSKCVAAVEITDHKPNEKTALWPSKESLHGYYGFVDRIVAVIMYYIITSKNIILA